MKIRPLNPIRDQKCDKIQFMEPFNRNSPGKLRIGLLFFLSLVGVGVYLTFQLLPYWIDAYDLKDFMADKARAGQLTTDDAIRRSIIAKARQLDIELTDQDIVINRSSTELSIATAWELDYNFFGIYNHTFTFNPQVDVIRN